MQLDGRNPQCKRTCLCNGMATNIGGTTRHRIMWDYSCNTFSTWTLCLIAIVFVMFPALCSSELVINDHGGFGAIWRGNSFNLDLDGENVCNRTRYVNSLSVETPYKTTSSKNDKY